MCIWRFLSFHPFTHPRTVYIPRKLFTLPHLEGLFFFFPLHWSKTASLALVASIPATPLVGFH